MNKKISQKNGSQGSLILAALTLLLSPLAFAATEVVCDREGRGPGAIAEGDGGSINGRIQQLQEKGKKVVVTHLAVSSAAGGSEKNFATIDKVCAVLTY